MTAPAVVSFDLDGTLITGPFTRVLSDLDDELSAQPGGDGAKRDILARHKELLGTDVLAAYDWEAIVADWLDERDLSAPFELLDRLGDHVLDGTRFIHDDTLALLQQLREHDHRVVVLTNGWRRYQLPVLRATGLLSAIDELITSDDVGVPKPAAAMFDAARREAAALVHVGDRVDHDIRGGNQAGAQTVLLRGDVPLHGSTNGHETALDDYLEQLEAAQAPARAPRPTASPVPTLLASSLREVVQWVLT